MECMCCTKDKDIVEYGPLGYCEQCRAWYKKEGEEEHGVYEYCTTRKSDPEKCDDFVQSLISRQGKIPDGENIPIGKGTRDTMREADRICAKCGNKNFIITVK